MPYFMGIDIGSYASKGVIFEDGRLVTHYVMPSGVNYRETAVKLKDKLLENAGVSIGDIASITSTGNGADKVDFSNQRVDDIRCCARGIISIFPSVRTVIDIQGQCTKVIRINEKGHVADFLISEKCASGSGRFLQIIANILRIDLQDIGDLSRHSKSPVQFTTGCAVFCESEAVSRISEGFTKEDIIAGVHISIANKISSLIDRIGLKDDCAITGGAGFDSGLRSAIEKKLGIKLLVPDNPQIITAIGAAMMAAGG